MALDWFEQPFAQLEQKAVQLTIIDRLLYFPKRTTFQGAPAAPQRWQ